MDKNGDGVVTPEEFVEHAAAQEACDGGACAVCIQYIYIYIYIYVCMYVCMYVCILNYIMCVCVCAYIYI